MPVIITADPDPSRLAFYQRALEASGQRVIPCRDGSEALAAFMDGIVDAVILNAELPPTSGYEVCREIRALGRGRGVPVIVIVPPDARKEDTVTEQFSSGVSACLHRSEDAAVFLERITRILEQSEEAIRKSTAATKLVPLEDLRQTSHPAPGAWRRRPRVRSKRRFRFAGLRGKEAGLLVLVLVFGGYCLLVGTRSVVGDPRLVSPPVLVEAICTGCGAKSEVPPEKLAGLRCESCKAALGQAMRCASCGHEFPFVEPPIPSSFVARDGEFKTPEQLGMSDEEYAKTLMFMEERREPMCLRCASREVDEIPSPSEEEWIESLTE